MLRGHQSVGHRPIPMLALFRRPEGKRPILQGLPESADHLSGLYSPSLLQGLEGLLEMG